MAKRSVDLRLYGGLLRKYALRSEFIRSSFVRVVLHSRSPSGEFAAPPWNFEAKTIEHWCLSSVSAAAACLSAATCVCATEDYISSNIRKLVAKYK